MCVICISAAGVKQPTKAQCEQMFARNPHGAGFMYLEAGRVRIEKGFMTFPEFWRAFRAHRFTAGDVTVLHFRISTQAGVQPEMTQPFPLTDRIETTRALDCLADLGIAHNGVIRTFSDPTDRVYSDTAHFIAEFLADTVKGPESLSSGFLDALGEATHSRFAFLDKRGRVFRAGDWIEDGGLYFSNTTYRRFTLRDVNRVQPMSIYR